MTTELPRLCLACVRYDGHAACTSFPDGIPDEILIWGGDHRESLHGEPPFELSEDGADALATWLRYSPAIDNVDK